MPLARALLCVGLTFSCAVTPLVAAPVVVETEALTPEQQKAKFHLPPGFEIQLVAAEPAIGKPMNLNFDARGRLWVSHSLEYPFPTAGDGVQPRDLREDMITPGPPRDHLSYFESIGSDGLGGKLVHFAQGLNIPIGQAPVVWNHAETAALGYSIPSIRLYQRSADDGLADKIQVLFTGFGNVDTHGMCNSFTRGFDGWFYACHGFRNTSRIERPNGEPLVLNSGNTIRFQPDGSALEQFTKGQVNPFGMSFDPWGNLYNADCHSMPITQLIRGATYQSFGKPHDGLGFGPDMIDHNHGSTGICGVACYESPQFPADYQQNIFICNPVNGQVHRDKLIWKGSSPKVDTQPEFVSCDDGWFRPVDVKLGPDGALYIADFYNAIIGHYEAPLQHPRRDRTHARIWRVVYTGEKKDQKPGTLEDLTVLPTKILVSRLSNPNFAVRMLATNLLVDRFRSPLGGKTDAAEPVADVLPMLNGHLAPNIRGAENARVHAAWVLARLVTPEMSGSALNILKQLSKDSEAIVRVHVAKIFGETTLPALVAERGILNVQLDDPDARVRRAAVEALAKHPEAASLDRLLALLESTPVEDTHLAYTLKIAIRARVEQTPADVNGFANRPLKQQRAIAGIASALPASRELTNWLIQLIEAQAGRDSEVPRAEWRSWIKPAARINDIPQLDKFVALLQKASGPEIEEQLNNVRACLSGRQAAGLDSPPSLTHWGEQLALDLLAQSSAVKTRWTYRPLPGQRRGQSPFGSQVRRLEGQRGAGTALISSFVGGEDETGINRSPVFSIPKELTFWLAGHNGFPNTPDRHVNLVRLIDPETGATLKQVEPPRNDVARQVKWDLQEFAGKPGAIEIVDGNDESAYAWIAAGKFSIPELNLPPLDAGPAAVALIKDLKLKALEPRLQTMLDSEDRMLRSHAATALASLRPDARITAILLWADDPDVAPAAETQMWKAVGSRSAVDVASALRELLAGASSDRQRKAADALVTDRAGAALMLDLANEGRLSLRLLQQPALVFKLAVLKDQDLFARATELTKSLPAPDQQIVAVIAARKAGFDPAKCSPEKGKAIFTKRCAVCHQIGTEGAKVGPQLDGVGIRGLDRLLEDILDPNKNVDAAFRSSAIALTDGRILTGLKRREEGTDLIFANQEGKEFRVANFDIEELKQSPTSLMPGNFGEQVPPEELADLLAWLLSQKPAKPKVGG